MKKGKRVANGGMKRSLVLMVSLLAMMLVVAGGTLAWLTAQDSVSNTFTPAHVSCAVEENFDGATKSDVNVRNTSDVPAYLRVKLVTYRVNEAGQHIGGTATIPAFIAGTGWVENGGYYYYTKPVEAEQTPETMLIDSITLTGSYDDADGGKQVIEVMAEAIQSLPDTAVQDAWGVTVNANGMLAFN